MDTQGLRLFVVAAEMLNIGAAGRRLGLAPAVASARLAKLEKQVGADLLHRSTRKVSLSPDGAAFLPFAREILAQEDAAQVALGNTDTEIFGTLRLAASSTFAQLFIAPVIPDFLDRYPGINLDLMLSDTKMNLIEAGFDLALRNYAVEDSSLRARRLSEDKRILCASPAYLASYGVPQTPDDLAGHRIITFTSGPAKNLSKESSGSSSSFPPPEARGRLVCNDGTSMRIATIAGAGISMNSYWSVYKEIQAGALVRVLPDYEIDDQAAIWLVYPQSNALNPKVRVFIDFLIEKIGEPPIWERWRPDNQ